MLEIDIFRNYFPKGLVVVMGDFWGIGCLEDAQMPWSPRLNKAFSFIQSKGMFSQLPNYEDGNEIS